MVEETSPLFLLSREQTTLDKQVRFPSYTTRKSYSSMPFSFRQETDSLDGARVK